MDAVRELDFKGWLRDNTTLREGSINLYARTINNFYRSYEELTTSNINSFVSKSVRSRNCYYMKYAFRHYLDYVGEPELYAGVLKVKIPSRKKLRKYYPRKMLLDLIRAIKNEKYRDIATIQFMTVARARGILTLHSDRVDLNFDEKMIRLVFIEKGDKEAFAFLMRKYELIIKKYLGKGYLFLNEKAKHADPDYFETLVQNERHYYYESVRSAARAIGLDNFGTHDFRRNAAELLKKSGANAVNLMGVMNHSDIRITLGYFNEDSEDSKELFNQLQGGDDED